jgi:hypothetical protein
LHHVVVVLEIVVFSVLDGHLSILNMVLRELGGSTKRFFPESHNETKDMTRMTQSQDNNNNTPTYYGQLKRKERSVSKPTEKTTTNDLTYGKLRENERERERERESRQGGP